MSLEGAVFNAGIRWSFLIPDLDPSPGATGPVERIDAKRVRQRSTLSGLGAVLFASGVVLLFIALYKDASHTAWSPLPIVALCVLAAAVIATLRQAAALMMGLPETRKSKPVWQRAAELLMQAQKGGKAADIRAATDQICRALQLEGWI
jgi:hypothetical protein